MKLRSSWLGLRGSRFRPTGSEAPFFSRERLVRPALLQKLLMALAAVVLAALATPDLRFPARIPAVGEIAPQNLKSPGEFLIEDEDASRQKREAATDAVRAVYDLDPSVAPEVDARIAKAFREARPFFEIAVPAQAPQPARRRARGAKQAAPAPVPAAPAVAPKEAVDRFHELLGKDVPREAVEFLAARRAGAADEEALRSLTHTAMKARIVSNREMLEDEARKGIVVHTVGTRREMQVKDLTAIDDLDQVRLRIREDAQRAVADDPPGRREHLVRLAQSLIRPNLTFNRNETEERKAKARESVKGVTIALKKGEIIARDGEPIEPRHVMILSSIRDQSLRRSVSSVFLGAALFFFLAIVIFDGFARAGVRKYKSDTRSVAFSLGLLVFMALLTRVSLFIADAVGTAFPFVSPETWRYTIPVAAGAMLARMVLNSETAIFFSGLFALAASLLVERNLFFGVFTLVGSIVGAHGVGQAQARSAILRTGVKVGLVNAAVIALWALMDGSLTTNDTLLGMLCGIWGGLVAGVIVIGVTPIAEWAGGSVTGMRLLELANRDQPLLRELAVKAPGTYHHSMIMANLVEAAAETIHANPLLARVSAYYHDIGKMLKPGYYVENMPAGENRHDKLTPSMSSLVVQAHVKDGIELAREHRLPEVIVNAIPQHHGTSLIKYFYEKAVESVDPETDEVNEEDYRYPGPKPQSRECGLLMLADSVEAGLRTLAEPNPARIRGAVQKIINNIFRDGQLDECDLTLRDLDAIARSFTDSLSAIYHSRIEYPEPVAKGEPSRRKKGDEGPSDRSADAGKDRPKRGGEAAKEHLKRLGMP